jgi:hypothetical protein
LPDANNTPNAIRVKEAKDALESVLRSPQFHSSRQIQSLLRYLLEKSLVGDDEALKERVIGSEVFGRPPDYNTADDPIVRARVGDLRKRLAHYYQEATTKQTDIRFVVPIGTYRVLFGSQLSEAPSKDHSAAGLPASILAAESHTSARPEVRKIASRRFQSWGWSLAVIVGAILLAVVLNRARFRQPTPLESFWSPVTSGSPIVFVYLGQNSAYVPTASYMKRYREGHPLSEDQKLGTLVRLSTLSRTDKLTSDDVYPENLDLVSAGNIAACTSVASLLVSMHRTPDIRTGDGLSSEDLSRSSAVFLGAFDNKWTMQTMSNLPFRFIVHNNDVDAIEEQDGLHRILTTKILDSHGTALTEYAIAARVFDPRLHKPVIIAAGLRAAGTRAAGEFITNPDAIASLLKNAPAGWEKKNVEVVLASQTDNWIPGPAHVIASKYW